MKRKRKKHVFHSHSHTRSHSPFFVLWELATLACVVIIAESFLVVPSLHLEEETLHQIEQVVQAAEIILIAEVLLLILIAQNKIHFVKKNWPSILAVLPFGGGFLKTLKIGWHAFEKTRIGQFFAHPIRTSKRWIHINLGLRL